VQKNIQNWWRKKINEIREKIISIINKNDISIKKIQEVENVEKELVEIKLKWKLRCCSSFV
jgi:hypothetical protein